MHLPSARSVPSVPTVHCCAAVPLHVYSCTCVPLAALAPATSTHLPPYPVICPADPPPVPPPEPEPWAPLHVNVAEVAAGRLYVNDSLPQFTFSDWLPPVPL